MPDPSISSSELLEVSRSVKPIRRHLKRLAKLSYLAPDIIAAIMAGAQPPQLTGCKLPRVPKLSNDWTEQCRQLGF